MFTLREILQVMKGERIRIAYYGNTPYEGLADEELVPVEWLEKRVSHIGFQLWYEMMEIIVSDEEDNTQYQSLHSKLRIYTYNGAIDSDGPFKVRSVLNDLFTDSFTATEREIIIYDGTRNYCTGIYFDASEQISTKNLHFMETIEKMLNQARKRGINLVDLNIKNEEELITRNPGILW